MSSSSPTSHWRPASSSSSSSSGLPSSTPMTPAPSISNVHANSPSSYAPLTPTPSASIQQIRRLIWSGTLPISVSLDASDLGKNSDRSIQSYLITAPRISYLPLLLQEIKSNLVQLVLDEPSYASLNEKELWFEYDGVPLRWHWPIGLLYDYHTCNPAPSSVKLEKPHPTFASRNLRDPFLSPNSNPSSFLSRPTNHHPPATSPPPFVNPPLPGSRALPWNIKLRLRSPPTERIHSNPGIESCRASFMSMVKEADFVRWGSTKRVVNLRRQEQDSLWEGVLRHDFETYWSVAQKLLPSTPPPNESIPTTTTPWSGGSGVQAYSLGSVGSTIGGGPSSRAPSINLSFDTTPVSISTSTLRASSGGVTAGSSSLMNQPNESQTSLAASFTSSLMGLTGGGGGNGSSNSSGSGNGNLMAGGTDPTGIPNLISNPTTSTTGTNATGSISSSTNHHPNSTSSKSNTPSPCQSPAPPESQPIPQTPHQGVGGMRNVPIRIHLPENAPVFQEPVQPTSEEGRPITLSHLLSNLFPLLFPTPTNERQDPQSTPPPEPTTKVIVQGIQIPLEAEIAWLGNVFNFPDGWLVLVLVLT
ncbi:hypothetical protein IE53DRAFT_388129 [Violaceomyces palustris]|uniref:Uncharacterized protein n=1 Tax=Violaceomyces palustris TaxID=1673888 RepID=A0ACD0NUV2_9BASI|nr:hypothetical protein IE53DRAFT_388129 [Violaceomyces palustris]